MSRFYRWSQKEHSFPVRIAATLAAGLLVAFLFPLLMVTAGPALDRRLGLPPLDLGLWNTLLGIFFLLAGFSLAFWTVNEQLTRGRGTPVPMLPTQELLVHGPFRYCRNPMTLGTVLVYLGIGIIARTFSGLAFGLIFIALLLLYLKNVEEKELAERFGAAYLRYKQSVPFLIPRLPPRQ